MKFLKILEKNEHLANTFEIDLHNLNFSPLRFFYKYIINNHDKIKGDILDLGVFRGRSLITTALILKKLGSKKKVYGFDTFSGFPKLSRFDLRSNFRKKKYFSLNHKRESDQFWKIKDKINSKNFNVNNISSSKNFSNSSLDLINNKKKFLI